MILKDILDAKGGAIHTISPQSTLCDVVAKLVLHNCGSLIVLDGEKMVGIITERDILRFCAEKAATREHTKVEARMTKELFTGTKSDQVGKIMGLMTEKRIRHLPVLEDGKLIGLVSIGDLVKAQHAQLSVENQYLRDYIQS